MVLGFMVLVGCCPFVLDCNVDVVFTRGLGLVFSPLFLCNRFDCGFSTLTMCSGAFGNPPPPFFLRNGAQHVL